MNQSSTSEKKALIIGCGIAGPVLAKFLQRAGITPIIYEGWPEPRDDEGAFLNLAPNGLDVLGTLGIKDEIETYGTPTTSILFQNHRGKQLGKNPERTLLIKRGMLTRGLRAAALDRGIAVEFGKRLREIEVTPEQTVDARFEDGSEASGDLLIGCDGIHSRTRRLIMPNAPGPIYTGVIDSGAIAPNTLGLPSDSVMRMTFGLKGFFGYQVVPSGEIFWFQNFTEPAEPDRSRLDAVPGGRWQQRLIAMHQQDHPPIAEIIRATATPIGRWPIYDMPSLPSWHAGPVCLIGDAAHAISPHVGQGASLAMEDAIVLAKCLRDIPTVERAFAAFEGLRRDRVETMVKAARRTGNQKAPANGLTRALRDLVLPFFLKMGVKSAEQAYAYHVDWDQTVTDLLEARVASTTRQDDSPPRHEDTKCL
jgi:2-polyprenyl-6-methoxyphenol hydroxylase-like FAD-dependent oxidoreductase